MDKDIDVSVLLGKTLKKVHGLVTGSSEVVFVTDNDEIYKLYSVLSSPIENIWGDVNSIIGSQLTLSKSYILPGVNSPGIDSYSYDWIYYEFNAVDCIIDEDALLKVRWLSENSGIGLEEMVFERLNGS